MSSKNILFVSSLESAPWGGSEELWHLIAGKLLDQGHQVTLDRIQWEKTPSQLQELINKGLGVNYRPNVHLPVAKTDLATRLFIRRFNKTFTARFKSFQASHIVVSMGGTFDDYLKRVSPLLVRASSPYSLIVQHTPEKVFIADEERQIFKDVFCKAANVFFVSRRNWEVVEHTLAVKLKNASVIYNPIKIRKQAALVFPSLEVIKMACVARLETMYKGQDVLLKTLSSVKWKSRNWQLSLYGKGPAEAYLKELILYYELQDKVTMKGHVEDIEEVWQKHHLLVLPSHSEGTPLSLLEASFCGRPAVVTDVGGNAEIVIDNETGFVAAAPAVNALDNALERAWSQQTNWELMGKQARRKVDEVVGYNNFASIIETICR